MEEQDRVDGLGLRALTEPGSDELLSDDVRQRLRALEIEREQQEKQQHDRE